jgi:CRISPR-associated protein Cmr3
MSIWLIEPRDPLIARDGRPAGTGGRLSTLGFPFPSTIAGAVRTRLASGRGSFDLRTDGELGELRSLRVEGPLLAELDGEGDGVTWLAPAPRDVLIVQEQGGKPCALRLQPRPLAGDCDSLREQGLTAVSYHPSAGVQRSKPVPAPAFWRWEELETWLTSPPEQAEVGLETLGLPSLLVERRSHLAIQPGERVGIDGMLFETAGLRFLHAKEDPEKPPRLAARRLALSLRCAGGTVAGRPLQLIEQMAPLGGERRLARWRRAPREWPGLPKKIRDSIIKSRRARLMLLTPAFFASGALPAWGDGAWPGSPGITVKVRAACVPRPAVVSGWDLAAGNGAGRASGSAKPTRRLAAAGSVYFVELTEGSKDEVSAWCDAVWLAAVSDDEQARHDGFGLAVLGTWNEEKA